MRRTNAIFLLALGTLLAGCDASRVGELERQVDQLQSRLAETQARLSRRENIHLALRDTKAEIGELNVAVAQLKSDALLIGYKERMAAMAGVLTSIDGVERVVIQLEAIVGDAAAEGGDQKGSPTPRCIPAPKTANR